MTVDAVTIKGTAHDWYTATEGLRQGLELVDQRLGLAAG